MITKCVNCGTEFETDPESIKGLCPKHHEEFMEIVKKISDIWKKNDPKMKEEGDHVRVAYITNYRMRQLMSKAGGKDKETFYADLKKRIEPVMDLALQARRIWHLYAEPDFLEKELERGGDLRLSEKEDVDQPQEGSKQAPA